MSRAPKPASTDTAGRDIRHFVLKYVGGTLLAFSILGMVLALVVAVHPVSARTRAALLVGLYLGLAIPILVLVGVRANRLRQKLDEQEGKSRRLQ